jgi:hypothetical protein
MKYSFPLLSSPTDQCLAQRPSPHGLPMLLCDPPKDFLWPASKILFQILNNKVDFLEHLPEFEHITLIASETSFLSIRIQNASRFSAALRIRFAGLRSSLPKKRGLKHPLRNTKNAGKDWFTAFFKINSDISQNSRRFIKGEGGRNEEEGCRRICLLFKETTQELVIQEIPEQLFKMDELDFP